MAVTAWLQAHGTEAGESIFTGVSLLGSYVLTGLIVALAVWFVARRDWRHVVTLVATCGGGQQKERAAAARADLDHRRRWLL